MKKTINLGKVDYNGTGRRINAVDIEVELEGDRLSIMGSIWNGPHTDIVSGGQNLEEIGRMFPANAKVQRIVEVWRRWHLNDMRAGCEHQRAEGWDKRPIDPSKPLNTYGTHFPGQTSSSWNMLTWVRRDEHPEGLLSYPCPVCGYRFGSAWLKEDLPADVLAEVESW